MRNHKGREWMGTVPRAVNRWIKTELIRSEKFQNCPQMAGRWISET